MRIPKIFFSHFANSNILKGLLHKIWCFGPNSNENREIMFLNIYLFWGLVPKGSFKTLFFCSPQQQQKLFSKANLCKTKCERKAIHNSWLFGARFQNVKNEKVPCFLVLTKTKQKRWEKKLSLRWGGACCCPNSVW